MAILDSQSVKVAGQRGKRGFDAGKKVMGRKRHLLVDSQGLILTAVVHPANVQDRIGAKEVLERSWFLGLKRIFADGGYSGTLIGWTRRFFKRAKTVLEIVPKLGTGFQVLPKRWIVERTFAWLGKFRRLSKDYEVKTSHSEAFLYLAASKLMLQRLANSA